MEILNKRPEHRVRESSALPAVLRVPGRAAQIGLAVCPPGWWFRQNSEYWFFALVYWNFNDFEFAGAPIGGQISAFRFVLSMFFDISKKLVWDEFGAIRKQSILSKIMNSQLLKKRKENNGKVFKFVGFKTTLASKIIEKPLD